MNVLETGVMNYQHDNGVTYILLLCTMIFGNHFMFSHSKFWVSLNLK